MLKSDLYKISFQINMWLKSLGLGHSKIYIKFKEFCRELLKRRVSNEGLFLSNVNGVQMFIPESSLGFYLLRPFEPYSARLFAEAVKPGNTVLDIGAQFGYYSLLAAKAAGPTGAVYAFEAEPNNFKILTKNIELHQARHVVPVQKLVSDHAGMLQLNVYENSDSHGMHAHPTGRTVSVLDIESITLDEFMKDKGPHVDVIKIDVEGHEPFVLKGALQLLAKNPAPILFCEIAPAFLRSAGVQPEEYLATLLRLGFDIQVIDEASAQLRPMTPALLKEAVQNSAWYANLYCRKQP